MEATVQLNVRLDHDVKVAGESSIREMGLSVTEFTRCLWDKLAQGGEECAQIQRVVLGGEGSGAVGKSTVTGIHESRSEALVRARALRDDWMKAYGYGPDDLLGPSVESANGGDGRHPDRQHRVEALEARMRERGTL